MHKVECSGPIFSKGKTNNINVNQIFTTGNLPCGCFGTSPLSYWWMSAFVFWMFCFGECGDLAIIFKYTGRQVFFFSLFKDRITDAQN